MRCDAMKGLYNHLLRSVSPSSTHHDPILATRHTIQLRRRRPFRRYALLLRRTRDYSPAQVTDTKLFSPIALRLVTHCRTTLYY
jgi:hypothetical protein